MKNKLSMNKKLLLEIKYCKIIELKDESNYQKRNLSRIYK